MKESIERTVRAVVVTAALAGGIGGVATANAAPKAPRPSITRLATKAGELATKAKKAKGGPLGVLFAKKLPDGEIANVTMFSKAEKHDMPDPRKVNFLQVSFDRPGEDAPYPTPTDSITFTQETDGTWDVIHETDPDSTNTVHSTTITGKKSIFSYTKSFANGTVTNTGDTHITDPKRALAQFQKLEVRAGQMLDIVAAS